MDTFKIAFDLSPCLVKNNPSVRRDSCYLFQTLAQSQQIKLDGFLYSNDCNLFARNKTPKNRAEAIEQASYFFHDAFKHERFFLTELLTRYKLDRLFIKTKKIYDLHSIDELYKEVVWRNVFSVDLNASYQKLILQGSFYYTNMTSKTISCLKTDGYDVAIFPHASAVRVSGKTQKIIRFRDPIELTDPDFVSREQADRFVKTIQQASLDSYFVCDTEPARKKLLHLFPLLAEKSCVIPSAVSFDFQRTLDAEKLKTILVTRSSQQLREQLSEIDSLEYMLNVGALTREKNVLTLIHAWEKINYQHHQDLKLILVSDDVVASRELQNVLRPHLEKTNIILLSGLTEIEKSYVFSHAALYVSTAYAENTNVNVLTAMHYGCPTVVSDIPVNRWQLGSATLYCDPYSELSIANVIVKLLYANDSVLLRNELIERGLEAVKLFAPEKLVGQWLALFEKLVQPYSHELNTISAGTH